MIKFITYGIVFLLLNGCAATKEEPIPESSIFKEFGNQLSEARSRGDSESQWLGGSGVKLHMVGPIFEANGKGMSRANIILQETLEFIAKNPKWVDTQTGINFSQKFSDTELMRYNSKSEKYTYIPVLMSNFFADEELLNAVVESSIITQESGEESAEIGFYLDEKAWKNKKIVLSGYKSIKLKGSPRNSSWFKLKLDMPEVTTVETIKTELSKMIVFALSSSNREFVSVDKTKVMKYSEFKFVTERFDGRTYAYTYQNREKQVKQDRKIKLESLNKESVIFNTTGTVFVDMDSNPNKLLTVRSDSFTYKVELISINAANQAELLFTSNSWDEKIQKAFLYSLENIVIIKTDKRLIFLAIDTKKIIFQMPIDNESTKILVDKNNAMVLLNAGNTVELYNLKGNKTNTIHFSSSVQNIELGHDGTTVFYLNSAGNLFQQNITTGQKKIYSERFRDIDLITTCNDSSKLILKSEKKVFVFDYRKDKLVTTHPFKGSIKAIDCNAEKNKLLVMFENGKIVQNYLSFSEKEQFALNLKYSNIDKKNNQYIAKYLGKDKIIYGGRDDLRIKSNLSIDEINDEFSKVLKKVSNSASWLDKQTVNQVVYVSSVTSSDKNVYKRLFNSLGSDDFSGLKKFLLETELNPILLTNQVDKFNELGFDLELTKHEEILVIKEKNSDVNTQLSETEYNLADLGYALEVTDIGSNGFEPKLYRSVSFINLFSLSANVMNVSLSDDGKTILIMRSDGVLLMYELESGDTWEVALLNDSLTAAALNSSNDVLVVATQGGVINIYDISNFERSNLLEPKETLRKSINSYTGKISQISFINSNKLLSRGKDQSIKIWDMKEGKRDGTPLLGHVNSVTACLYDQSLKKIISSSEDKTIRVWNPVTREQVFSFKGKGELFLSDINTEFNAVALITGSQVEIRNLVTRDVLGAFDIPLDNLKTLTIGFNAEVLYATYTDRVEVRKVISGRLISIIPFNQKLKVKKSLIDTSYKNLIIIENNSIHVVNVGRFLLEKDVKLK